MWERFRKYELTSHSADDVTRVGFYGKCDPNHVDILAGCRASDLSPTMLAGFFFPDTSEQLQFEDLQVQLTLLKNHTHLMIS